MFDPHAMMQPTVEAEHHILHLFSAEDLVLAKNYENSAFKISSWNATPSMGLYEGGMPQQSSTEEPKLNAPAV
jgi:hypothetical protein